MNESRPERRLPVAGAPDPNEREPTQRDGLHDLLFIVFKWLPQSAVIVAVGALCGLLYLILIRGQMYEATAKIYVRSGVEQTPSRWLGSDSRITYLAQARGAVESEVDLLRNNEVLVGPLVDEVMAALRTEPVTLLQKIKRAGEQAFAVVRELLDAALVALNLKPALTPTEAMRLRLFRSIVVNSSPNSDVIVIALRWPDKVTAAALLNRFVTLYLGFRSTAFEDDREIAFLKTERDDAKRALETVDAEMASPQTSTTPWKWLERRHELAEPRYREAEKRLSEAREISDLRHARLSNVVLVQPPAAAALPVGVGNLTLFGIIVLVSVIMACGWALVREMFDNRLHQANQAAHLLGLPLLGDLPEHTARLQVDGVAARELALSRESKIALDRAAAAINKRIGRKKCATLAVVGAASAEGATTVSIGLSYALAANRGRQVLLVEADGAQPTLLARIGALGLEVDLAPADGRLPSGLRRAAVMGGFACWAWERPASNDAGRALLCDALTKDSPFIDGAGLVVIDLPPVLDNPEAALAAGQTDGTLFVAAAARYRAGVHQSALDELRLHDANLIGLLFNRRRDRIPAWLAGVWA